MQVLADRPIGFCAGRAARERSVSLRLRFAMRERPRMTGRCLVQACRRHDIAGLAQGAVIAYESHAHQAGADDERVRRLDRPVLPDALAIDF